jgi:hypothetical protein
VCGNELFHYSANRCDIYGYFSGTADTLRVTFFNGLFKGKTFELKGEKLRGRPFFVYSELPIFMTIPVKRKITEYEHRLIMVVLAKFSDKIEIRPSDNKI